MAADKREFRQIVLSNILPNLESQGFKKWKPGIRDEVPVVYLERYRDGKRELLEVQFDKYGRLAFYVNLASVTGETVETMFEGILPTERVTCGHLCEQCRLVPGKMSQAFKPIFLSRSFSPNKAAEQVANLFIRLFAEANEWFEKGVIGPHIRKYRL